MKCGNQHCVRGLESVVILDSTLQEIAVLAEHLPNAKLHMHKEMWPCRYCNPQQYEQFRARHEDAARRAAGYVR
jgi:hypothetical protein